MKKSHWTHTPVLAAWLLSISLLAGCAVAEITDTPIPTADTPDTYQAVETTPVRPADQSSVEESHSGQSPQSHPAAVSSDSTKTASIISLEEAKRLALAEVGLQTATFIDRESELDDGKYELEFFANGVTYEVDVDAYTGRIVETDVDYHSRYDNRYHT